MKKRFVLVVLLWNQFALFSTLEVLLMLDWFVNVRLGYFSVKLVFLISLLNFQAEESFFKEFFVGAVN